MTSRSASAGAKLDPLALRDHAEEILRASALDMVSAQTGAQQSEKSRGTATAGEHSGGVNQAAALHAVARLHSEFDLTVVVAEYRALRASVIRLWRESAPDPDLRDLDDLTRFNETIDQSLTEAIRSYTKEVARERESMLANEQASRVEAETANRAKDMFLATLSHEMRTPLNAIVGWVTILRGENCDQRRFDRRTRSHRAEHQGAGPID